MVMSRQQQEDHNLASLPETCFGTLQAYDELILIKRGEIGYFPTEGYTTNDMFPTFDAVANLLNERLGVTIEQRLAMEAGSMFGFDLPIADPARHVARVPARA